MKNYQYTILLIGNNHEIELLLNNSNHALISFENMIDATDYYYQNANKIDIIIDLIVNRILLSFNQSEIKTIEDGLTASQLMDQINQIIAHDIKNKEFSKSLALSMLDHNEIIYHKLLRRYYEENHNLSHTIYSLLDADKFFEIKILVHKIKGLSLNLGSEKLFEIAKTLNDKLELKKAERDDIIHFIRFHEHILEYIKEEIKE